MTTKIKFDLSNIFVDPNTTVRNSKGEILVAGKRPEDFVPRQIILGGEEFDKQILHRGEIVRYIRGAIKKGWTNQQILDRYEGFSERTIKKQRSEIKAGR